MRKKRINFKIESYNGEQVKDCISSIDLKAICDIYNEFTKFVFDTRMKYNILEDTCLASPNWILSSENIDIAKYNGKVIGYISYYVRNSWGKYLVTICNVHVKNEFKKMGVGSKLVRNLFDKYKNGQFTASCVFEDNHPAQAFWNKLGFVTKIHSDLFVDFTER